CIGPQDQHGQAVLASTNVICCNLAGFLDRTPDAQHIVPNLEAHANCHAHFADTIGGFAIGSADHRSGPGTVFNDGGGLAGDHLEVILRGSFRTTLVVEILHLAAHDFDSAAVELAQQRRHDFDRHV